MFKKSRFFYLLLLFGCLSANTAYAQAKKQKKEPKTNETKVQKPYGGKDWYAPYYEGNNTDKKAKRKFSSLFVIAANGLDLYEKPQKTAKILLKIPCAAAVQPLELNGTADYMLEISEKTSTIFDEVSGFWLKVQYQNTVGYCFNNFLNIEKPDSLTTDFVLLEPNKYYQKTAYKNTTDYNWYGIFQKDTLRLATKKLANIAFFRNDIDIRNLGLTATESQETTDSLCFIIGLRKKNNTEIASGMLPESVYMGGLYNEKNSILGDKPDSPDQIQIGFTDWRLKLDKTFQRVAPKKEGDRPTAALADWKLLLVRNDFREKQILVANDSLFSPPFSLACYGDFDEDGKLDFMIKSHTQTQKWNPNLLLFLSSIADKGTLVKQAAVRRTP